MKNIVILCLISVLFIIQAYPQRRSAKRHAPKAVSTHQSKIDGLNSAREVEEFLASVDPLFEGCKVNVKLKSNEREAEKLTKAQGAKPWMKADLDGNGYTDLLVNLWMNGEPVVYCITDSGANRFAVKQVFGKAGQHAIFGAINSAGAVKYVTAFYPEPIIRNSRQKNLALLKTPLTIMQGDFIDYNPSPAKHSIEQIEYHTTMCYGRCPVFKLHINQDKSASFEGIKFTAKTGKFTATIDDKSYSALIDMLNYIDFAKLENNYKVMHTDAQTATLTIMYDGGKVKTISDYGLRGTAGLTRVHALLFTLRETQDWK